MKLKNSFLSLTLALAAMGGASGVAHADILALYTFDNVRTSSDTDINSNAGTFDNGSGYESSKTPYIVDAGNLDSPLLSVASDTTPTSQANALSGNDYFSFKITPSSGFSLNLATLTYDSSTSGIQGNYIVRSSVDSFAANLDSAVTHTQGTTYVNRSVTVSGTLFDNLTAETEFRFYLYDGSTVATNNLRIDNVTLSGTTSAVAPVPEPSTIALFVIGLGGMGFAMRRKKSAESAEASGSSLMPC